MSGLPTLGDVIGSHFRIEAEIGRGAMGVVYRAHDPSNRRVAIKVLLPESVDAPDAVERFTNEARAARVLTSEHTVRVYDAGTLASGLPYIVMELLEGMDVATILEQRGPLPIAEACDMVIEACAALAEAHARGMVHRDLKPANLFAAREADGRTRVKVLDFGLSKVAAQNRQVALTSTGTILGTPYYMAPEQLRSSKGADLRADVWSLGVILYELVSGKMPFEGTSFGMLFSQVVSKEPGPLVSFRPDVPAGFTEIVHRCLEKNRDDRYPDVTALVSALAAFASPGKRPPPAPRQGRLGGTLLMPSPVSALNPARASTPPAPPLSLAPPPLAPPPSLAPPAWPAHPPSAQPRPAPTARPSRNVALVVIASVLLVLAALGGILVLYFLRARA